MESDAPRVARRTSVFFIMWLYYLFNPNFVDEDEARTPGSGVPVRDGPYVLCKNLDKTCGEGSIDPTPSGRFVVLKLVQLLKANFPIDFTLAGI